MSDPVISAVVPIVERHSDLKEVFRQFAEAFKELGEPFEFIFVLDGDLAEARKELEELQPGGVPVKVVKLGRAFGEAAALRVGFERARGDYIFTVPPSFQVEPAAVKKLWEELRGGADLAVARRYPRVDSIVNRMQSALFHFLVRRATGTKFHDISCGLRALRRSVLQELNLYGGLHRFIPVLAAAQGFKVTEVPVPQRPENLSPRFFGLPRYTRYLLDILTLFFVTKFTMMPLRFFGGIAAVLIVLGAGITGYLGLYRLLGYGPIANRPLLLLGVLLIAVGMQILSLGLIGELVIFLHARELKPYRVEEVIE